MQLSPHEQERLLVHVAADVAEKRRARGPKEAEHLAIVEPLDLDAERANFATVGLR